MAGGSSSITSDLPAASWATIILGGMRYATPTGACLMGRQWAYSRSSCVTPKRQYDHERLRRVSMAAKREWNSNVVEMVVGRSA